MKRAPKAHATQRAHGYVFFCSFSRGRSNRAGCCFWCVRVSCKCVQVRTHKHTHTAYRIAYIWVGDCDLVCCLLCCVYYECMLYGRPIRTLRTQRLHVRTPHTRHAFFALYFHFVYYTLLAAESFSCQHYLIIRGAACVCWLSV